MKSNGGEECDMKIWGAGMDFTGFDHMMTHHLNTRHWLADIFSLFGFWPFSGLKRRWYLGRRRFLGVGNFGALFFHSHFTSHISNRHSGTPFGKSWFLDFYLTFSSIFLQKTSRELPNLEHALQKCVPEWRFEICTFMSTTQISTVQEIFLCNGTDKVISEFHFKCTHSYAIKD